MACLPLFILKFQFDLLIISTNQNNYLALRVRFLQYLRLEPDAYTQDLGALRQVLGFLPRQGVLRLPDILYIHDKKV
jgi:hypothetical protein